jgi:NTE family protein
LATLTNQDILIRPELDDIGFADFERSLETIPKGTESAERALPQLLKISLSHQDWLAYLDTRTTGKREQPVIDFIRIVNDSNVSDEVIKARLSLKPGQRFDEVNMTADLSEIYGLELFEEVSYRIIEENDQTGVEVLARRSENGQKFIRFGLALQENFDGETGFQMSAAFTNLAINQLGGEIEASFTIGDEFGLFAEFYQPVDYTQRYYLFANAGGGKFNRNIFDDDGRILSQVRISEAYLQTGAGRNFGRWGTMRVGLRRAIGKAKGRIGFPDDVSIPFDDTAFIAQFSIDTLDNVQFPHRGMVIDAAYKNSLSWLDGDNRVDTFLIGGYHPFSWGRNTLGFNYRFATSISGTPNEIDLFQLGGFARLTAYAPGQLTGNHGGAAGVVYYRRIAGGLRFLTQTPVYVGGLLEAGNVWNQRSDVSLDDLHTSASLFFGADTFLGPVYLGYGVGDGGQTSAFLFIGQIF